MLQITISYFSDNRKSTCSGNADGDVRELCLNVESVMRVEGSRMNSIIDSERSSLMQSENGQSSSQLAGVENRLDGYCLEDENVSTRGNPTRGNPTRTVQSSAGLVHQAVAQVEMTTSQENNCAHTNPGYHNRNHTDNMSVSNTRRTRTVSQQTESRHDPTDHIDPDVGIDGNNTYLQNSQEPDINRPQIPSEADELEVFSSIREHENPTITKPCMQERPAVHHHFAFYDVNDVERHSQGSVKRSDSCSVEVSNSINEPGGDENSMLHKEGLLSSVEFRNPEEETGQREKATDNEVSDFETPLKLIDDLETPLKQTVDETNLKVIDHEMQQKCIAIEEKGSANDKKGCCHPPKKLKEQNKSKHQAKDIHDGPSSILDTGNHGSNESIVKTLETHREQSIDSTTGYSSMQRDSSNEETALKGTEEVALKEPEQETVAKKAMGDMMMEKVSKETTDETLAAKVTPKNPLKDLRAVMVPKAKPEAAPKEIKSEIAQKAESDEIIPDVIIIPEASQDVLVGQVSSETILKGTSVPAPEITPRATMPIEASPVTAVPSSRPQEAKPRAMATTVRKTATEVFTILET